MKRIIASLGAFALAAGLSLGLATSAQARTVPVVYNSMSFNWSHPHVRPGFINISMGAPYAINLHWTSWNSKSARATGRLEVNNCVPNCAQGTTSYYKLVVTLSHVKHHNGRAYFSVMGWHLPGHVLRVNYPAPTGRWVNTRYFRYSRSFWR